MSQSNLFDQSRTCLLYRINELENNNDAFEAAKYNETIVELTAKQVQMAIENIPSIFENVKDLPSGFSLRPSSDASSDARSSFKESQMEGRICPVSSNYAAINLARNNDGNLVQVVQVSIKYLYFLQSGA